jgi:NADPH:quinone reductase-like Zn-dependent oxidoreductase
MKAAVVRDFDQGPRYDSFELPFNEGDLVLDVLAAALSPRVRSGASGAHYTSKGALPMVPGIDGVGRLPDGQRVYFLGANDAAGTMAERALAEPRLTVPLPESVSASTIAAGMLPAISSWVGLTKRVPIQPGQSVLALAGNRSRGPRALRNGSYAGAALRR